MSSDLFVSYSSDDGSELAKAVADTLTSTLGLDVYVAERDEESSGRLIDQRIREAIRQSKRFVVILTPQAITSDWVLGEITAAMELNKEMLVYRQHDVSISDTPIVLQARHQREFTIPKI